MTGGGLGWQQGAKESERGDERERVLWNDLQVICGGGDEFHGGGAVEAGRENGDLGKGVVWLQAKWRCVGF